MSSQPSSSTALGSSSSMTILLPLLEPSAAKSSRGGMSSSDRSATALPPSSTSPLPSSSVTEVGSSLGTSVTAGMAYARQKPPGIGPWVRHRDTSSRRAEARESQWSDVTDATM
uniref:Uncharacterized protein n=1 Tax=Ixodes ricinus TaxID=34613 RepID=A0A6B0UKK2_IXORI